MASRFFIGIKCKAALSEHMESTIAFQIIIMLKNRTTRDEPALKLHCSINLVQVSAQAIII